MEYFPRSRQHKPPPATERVTPQETKDSAPSYQDEDLGIEQSIYIFPNPSSAPPSPKHATLVQGVRQVLYAYPVEPSRSRSASMATESSDTGWEWHSTRSPLDSNVSGTEDFDAGPWEWPAPSDASIEQNELVLEEDIVGRSRWDLLASRRMGPASADERAAASPLAPLALRVRRYTSQQISAEPLAWIRSRTQSTASSLSSTAVIPHPRIRIPLLSFFASWLGVDEDTLDLIEHTPAHSTLFPGCATVGPDAADTCSPVEYSRPHGMLALVARDPDLVREGLRISSNNDMSSDNHHPFAFVPIPSLGGILSMVNGIWSTGRLALREIL